MTTVLTRSDESAGQSASRRSTDPAVRSLPWLIVGVAWVAGLHRWGTPLPDIAAYSLYWALTLVLPGTLMHRALRGSRGNLPEDLGYGAVVGLVLEMVAWALSAVVGGQSLLRWWAAPVVVAFVAVPALRRHWRITDPEPLPARWSWMIAGALLAAIGWGLSDWATVPLPPTDFVYYQDLFYHLSLVHELTRTVPFEVPQLAGDTLRYHYLSDAHMAAASMITGVSPTTILLRLFAVPIVGAAIVAFAALARDVTGRWWAGPLAGAVAVCGQAFALRSPIGVNGSTAISYGSPSLTYAMPLLALLLAIAVDALRHRTSRSVWFLVPVLAVVCAGAKSSLVPPVFAGLLLAGLMAWWRDRRVPWRVVGLLGGLTVAMAIGVKLFAGGGSGVLAVQPLALLGWIPPYAETLGADDGPDAGGLLPLGLRTASGPGLVYVAGIIAWWFVMQTPRLLGVTMLATRTRRFDPVAWLLAGTTAAGLGAAWLFYHPAQSQIYFFQCVAPVGALLTVWLLADRFQGWRAPVIGFAAGTVWPLVIPATTRPADPERWTVWAKALALPAVWTLCAAVLVTAVALLFRADRAALVSGAMAAVLGLSLGSGPVVTIHRLVERWSSTVTKPVDPRRIITAEEQQGALWLDAHAAPDDVVATNVHCQPISRSKPCDARAFWVSGLGGHRTVLEGWGYSDEALAAHGRNGLGFLLQPAPDPALKDRNDRLFTAPTAADLAAFRREYGVRWLLADHRASTVSPRLAELTTVRYRSGTVIVYELR
jgi:hypothetical protein